MRDDRGVNSVSTKFRGRVVTVNVETVTLPTGAVADFEIIHHPGGAAVVAIDAEHRVCLLRQFRPAAGGWIWELPAGKLEPGLAALLLCAASALAQISPLAHGQEDRSLDAAQRYDLRAFASCTGQVDIGDSC